MSYQFGWWDSIEADPPAMVNRYTHERLVRRGACPPGSTPGGEPWLRFDYVADDLVFPLAVKWAPEHGEIVVDYNLSAQLWREETGSPSPTPPFGAYLRIDDLAADALWCWPGVLDAYFARRAEQPTGREPPMTLYRLGGWSNSVWSPQMVRETHNDYEQARLKAVRTTSFSGGQAPKNAVVDYRTDFLNVFEKEYQFDGRSLIDPNAAPPAKLIFVDPFQNPEFDADYPEWLRHWISNLTYQNDGAAARPASKPPHAVSVDRKRAVALLKNERRFGHYPTATWFLELQHESGFRHNTHADLPRLFGLGPYIGGPFRAGTPWVTALNTLLPHYSSEWPESSTLPSAVSYDSWLGAYAKRNSDRRAWLQTFNDSPEASLRASKSSRWDRWPQGFDGLMLQRDYVDALFAFTSISSLIADGSKDDRHRDEQKFDCIVSSAMFLGGRVVWPRVQIQFFK
jgi:hypothetical protein